MHVRPGTYNAHVAQQHVPELWQLIQAGPPQKITDACYAHIVLQGLLAISILVHHHGAELIAQKALAATAYAALNKKYRTP